MRGHEAIAYNPENHAYGNVYSLAGQ